jgi:hypothetical protein
VPEAEPVLRLISCLQAEAPGFEYFPLAAIAHDVALAFGVHVRADVLAMSLGPEDTGSGCPSVSGPPPVTRL